MYKRQALNHERVVLVAPGGVNQNGETADGLGVAAAVAGAIAGESDPAVPLGGAVLTGLYGLSGRYSDCLLYTSSFHWANSAPMKESFFPGWVIM